MRIAARTPRPGDPTVQPPARALCGRRVRGPAHPGTATLSGEVCRQLRVWLRRKYALEQIDVRYPMCATSRMAPAAATQTPAAWARPIDGVRAMYSRSTTPCHREPAT